MRRRDGEQSRASEHAHGAAEYTYDTAALKKNWARLHAGDAEPLPADAKVLAAWALLFGRLDLLLKRSKLL